MFLVNFVILGWCGKNPPEGMYVVISQCSTAFYFLFFALLPVLSKYEKAKPLPTTI
jgi:quinol-cytochrome oxidoreductase complex cytochrome b subunit